MNRQLAKYLSATFLATFADRLAQFQLLSIVVLSGPDGSGFGINTFALLFPLIIWGFGAGALADWLNKRKLLVVASIARAALTLMIPTALIGTGAVGPEIAGFLFLLVSITVLSWVTGFGIVPEIDAKLRSANACSMLVAMVATACALVVNLNLNDLWLPTYNLRFAALLYLAAAIVFSTVKRVQVPVHKAQCMQKHSSLIMLGGAQKALFKTLYFLYFTNALPFYMMLSMYLQNSPLNNGTILELFASIATGFACGAILMLAFGKHLASSGQIFWNVLLNIALCLSFSIWGTAWSTKPFLILLGMLNAVVLIHIDTLAQRIIPPPARAKVYGASMAMSGIGYTLATLVFEQLAVRYSTVTTLQTFSLTLLILSGCFLIVSKPKKRGRRRSAIHISAIHREAAVVDR